MTSRDATRAAIGQLYDRLCTITGSPVAAINRAITVAETRGPAAVLEALPGVPDGSRLADYQPYWAACAELLSRLGDIAVQPV